MNPQFKHLHLSCQGILIGSVEDIFEHQDTWFGRFIFPQPPANERAAEFIAFCKEWHARLRAGAGADAADFDLYPDMLAPGTWTLKSPDVTIAAELRIDEAPVFCDDEISWRLSSDAGNR